MKQLTNANFHDFNAHPLFIGMYTGNRLIRQENDAKDKTKKKGDLMGYEFNDENGMPVLVGASSAIEAIMDNEKIKVQKDTIMSFEFQGKGVTKNNKPFNRFRVISFDDWNEATAHHSK